MQHEGLTGRLQTINRTDIPLELIVQPSDGESRRRISVPLTCNDPDQGPNLHARWSAEKLSELTPDFRPGERLNAPGDVWLRFERKNGRWEVAFKVLLHESRVCVRCGEETPYQVDHSGVWLLEERTQVSETPHAFDTNHDTFRVTKGAIQLTDLLIDILAESGEMYPLCRPDCAGLCSQCGKNLNVGVCVCPPVRTGVLAHAMVVAEIQPD